MNTFKLVPNNNKQEKAAASIEISWDYAKLMIRDYRENPHALQIHTPMAGGPNSERLDGFSIRREHIEAIFNYDNQVDEIFMMFAVTQESHPRDYDQQNFTTVIAGLRNNNLVTGKVYDFCDPCPTKCPVNFDTEVES